MGGGRGGSMVVVGVVRELGGVRRLIVREGLVGVRTWAGVRLCFDARI